MSREDIITTLQVPTNASLCGTHLSIAIPKPEPTVEALLEAALAATDEVIANWSRRMDDSPSIFVRQFRVCFRSDLGPE
jgi:hypothetical protein